MKFICKAVLSIVTFLCASANVIAQTAPNLENGFKSYGSYDGSHLDTVNLMNGNLMLHALLLPNYPQRGSKLTLQSFLYQTSKTWQALCSVDFNGTLSCQWVLGRRGVSLRQSGGLTVQRILHEYDSGTGQTTFRAYGYTIQDSMGTSHQMAAGTGTMVNGDYVKFDSIDLSGYHLELSNPDSYGVMNTATVTDRQGNQYVPDQFQGGSDTGPSFCPQLQGNHLPPVRIGGGLVEPIIDDAPMGQQDCPQVAFAVQVTDSNGNQITNPTAGPIDTLGRNFPFFNGGTSTTDYSGCASNYPISSAALQNYNAPDGSIRQMKLCYGSIAISTAFNSPSINEVTGNSSQLLTIVLADGTKWGFDYDNYGEVTFVLLPTGGSIRYTWTTIPFPSCAVPDGGLSRAVATRTLNDNNGHSSTWIYHWGPVVQGTISNIVTDPMLNDTVHVFTSLDGSGVGGCGFFETQTRSYQGAGSSRQLLKQVDTTYNSTFDGTNTVWSSNPGTVVPISIKTTIYPSGKISLIQKTYAQPTAGQSFFGNVATEKIYDWGQGQPGALLRETDTVYQWQKTDASGNQPYLAANLLDLPASVVVVSPNAADNIKTGCPITPTTTGNCMSETDYFYDEPNYLVTPSPAVTTQHFPPPYGVRGNLTTVSRWLNTSNTFVSSHTKWYDTGEPYLQIDPLGHTTTTSYDSFYQGAYATQTCSPQTGSVAHCVSGTYDFNTGVLTSLTNENATTQASGNTPGDSAHTSNYTYDYLFRLTSAQAPPDPANSSLRARTSLAFSSPGAVPITVQRTTSVTASLADSAMNFFDGLARVYKGQHVLPNGTAAVDTTFDAAEHPATVSNPYFTTADSTYGTTTRQYDALDRATQVTEQDGSISNVSYDVAASASVLGNCNTATDEAGKQRRACSDVLGRLVEVDEPNPGAQAIAAQGSFTISGTLRSQSGVGAVNAASGRGSLTITGSERSISTGGGTYCAMWNNEGDCVDWEMNPPFTTYDTGALTIVVNGHADSTRFDSASTPTNLASALAGAINADVGAFVSASASNAVLALTARQTGASTNYSWSISSSPDDPADFGSAGSYTGSPTSGALSGGVTGTGGITVYDTGTVTVTIGSFSASASYNQSGNSTAAQIAAALAGSGSTGLNRAGSPVSAAASGATVNLTYNTAGAVGNGVVAAASSQSTQTQWTFSPPSFTSAGTTLANGLDAGDVNNTPMVTQYQYDPLSNVICVEQHGNSPAGAHGDGTAGTGCSAAPASDPTSTWRVRRFTYDSLSRLLTAKNPESGTITYSYDADGNLLQKTAPAPNQTGTATQTVSYCYDALHRITGRAYGAQNCPLTSPVVSYTYDSGTNAKGKLSSLTDQAGTASYSYDVLGRLSSETRTLIGANNASIAKSLSYDYNLDGSLKALHYPSGAVITYTPDSAGRMLSAVDTVNSINYVTGATYGPDSSLTGLVSGSGGAAAITSSFSYNKRLQPVTMSAATPSQTVFSIGYDFHAGNGTAGTGTNNGNVFGIYNYKDRTRDQSFTYDALNRLTSAQNAGTNCAATTVNGKTEYWGNTYGYDAWGNLLNKSVTKCSAENFSVAALTNNQLSGYAYDAAGNMTHDLTSGLTYSFDQENRITGANGYTYTYDGDGNRVRKSNGNLAANGTLYWSMTPGVVAESDLAGTLKSEYVFFGGERMARKDYPSNAVAYYFSDHLKTASVITDSAGVIKNESDFYPWGGELQFLANDSNHYKYGGHERDAESGLDYYGARYYSNGLGRFVTPDWAAKPAAIPYAVIGDPQSLNLYTYVRNIPTVNVDTDGHETLNANTNDRGNTRMVPCQTDQCRAADEKISGAILFGFGATLTAGAASGPEGALLARNLLGLGLATAPVTMPIAAGVIEGLTPGAPSLSIVGAAESFGFKSGFAVAGSLVGGELKNGAQAAVSFSKVGSELGVGISFLKGPAGSLATVEQGAIAAAKSQGASSLKMTAIMVKDSIAKVLAKNGFTQELKDGKATGNWIKEIKIKKEQ